MGLFTYKSGRIFSRHYVNEKTELRKIYKLGEISKRIEKKIEDLKK